MHTHTSDSIVVVIGTKSPSISNDKSSLVMVVTEVVLILLLKVDSEVMVDTSKRVSVGIDEVITCAIAAYVMLLYFNVEYVVCYVGYCCCICLIMLLFMLDVSLPLFRIP